MGSGRRTDLFLRDPTRARVCRGSGDSGGRVRGLVNPRWLGGVLPVPKSGPSKLRGALDSPLPGFGGGGDTGHGTVSAGGEATVGGRAGLAGSMSGAEDLAAPPVDGHWPAGNKTGCAHGRAH